MSFACSDIDVLLLAAGFGKRLRPLTETIPKPMVEVGGEKLIDRHLKQLKAAGFKRVFVNTHYRADVLAEHLKGEPVPGLELKLVNEPTLLDTGGAIKNIESEVRSNYLLTVNSDTYIEGFPYAELVQQHVSDEDLPLATLALREDEAAKSYGEVGIDAQGRIVSFVGEQYAPTVARPGLMYLGVQILSRSIFSRMPVRGEIFSITRDIFLPILKENGCLKSFVFSGAWHDVGTPERLAALEKSLAKNINR